MTRQPAFAMLPLIAPAQAHGAVAWRAGAPVTLATFLQQVYAAADALPERAYAVNVCDDRYSFMVGFAATLLRGQTNLLPPSRAKGVFEEIARRYGDAYCLTDRVIDGLEAEQHRLVLEQGAPGAVSTPPSLAGDQLCAIAFTSGSTGRPRPNEKRWHHLVLGGTLAARRFGVDSQSRSTIVATVPAQHMYGLETSIMLPLVSGASVHSARPLFPADVCAALGDLPGPRVLVTTPVHLRACVDAELGWPRVAQIISATAPLPAELARRAERAFGCPVREIFGFSEAGSVASRRSLDGDLWRLYDGLVIEQRDGACYVSGGHVPGAVAFADVIEPVAGGYFKHLGRGEEIVNLAGKRTSLAELNQRLCAIEGVVDGVFAVPPESADGITRLTAFVVAPQMSTREILDALRGHVDPAFLPRPLRKVHSLPRNATGKIVGENLIALLAGRDDIA